MAETIYCHCNSCGRPTHHVVVKARNWQSVGTETALKREVHQILECRGCESTTFRHEMSWYDDTTDVERFPPEISRRAPDWIYLNFSAPAGHNLLDIPFSLSTLMQEIYKAVQADLRRLAAMGIRAALESIMIDKVGDSGSFKGNMDLFQEKGYVSVRQRGHLDAILDAGHAAIHRGWEPSAADLTALLDITEASIQTAYLHDKPVDDLSRRIPPRPAKSR